MIRMKVADLSGDGDRGGGVCGAFALVSKGREERASGVLPW